MSRRHLRDAPANRARDRRSPVHELAFLKLLFDAVKQAVIATDAEGRILHWNRFAEQLYGWSADEVVHRDIVDVLAPQVGPDRARAAMANGSRNTGGDWWLRRRDGTPILVHAIPTPIWDNGRQVGIVGVSWDVSEKRRLQNERKRIEGELGEQRKQLHELTRRLLEGQEAERRVLARELHDDFGQSLTALRLSLDAVRRELDRDHADRLTDGIALVDLIIDQVRRITLDLRPALLDDLGLVAALRSLIKRMAEGGRFEGRLSVEGLDARLPAAVETCSFRLVQEALTNVARHADARHVDVELGQVNGEVRVAVRDDGRGFDSLAAESEARRGASLGLLSMHERVTLAGGHMEIRSALGRGTTIVAHLPIAQGWGT